MKKVRGRCRSASARSRRLLPACQWRMRMQVMQQDERDNEHVTLVKQPAEAEERSERCTLAFLSHWFSQPVK